MTTPIRRDQGMSKVEIALLLSLMAAYDQRTIGDADVEAWHSSAQYAHWDATGAKRAVAAHYAETRKRIMPADITDFLRNPAQTGERICEY